MFHLLLQDEDPYVRKTAAMCVAKLHDINSELVEDQGFLDTLKVYSLHDMLSVLIPAASIQRCQACRRNDTANASRMQEEILAFSMPWKEQSLMIEGFSSLPVTGHRNRKVIQISFLAYETRPCQEWACHYFRYMVLLLDQSCGNRVNVLHSAESG